MIQTRNNLREQRRFEESDILRKRLLEEFSVELIDHKKRTIWTAVE
jgi:cysteinyl-tRNA synthetase